jgi:hypothetical protein
MRMTTQHLLVPRLRMTEAVPSLPLTPSISSDKDYSKGHETLCLKTYGGRQMCSLIYTEIRLIVLAV